MMHFSLSQIKIIFVACLLVSAQVHVSAQSTTPPSKTPSVPSKAAAVSSASKTAQKSATATDSQAQLTKKQVFILPLDGTVGIGLRHDEMEQVAKIADSFGPGQIIVLRINSNGGLVTEGDKIAATLTRIKVNHKIVAWIEKAISGGAFTALYCDHMYFMPEAALGSITMWSGDKVENKAAREDWKIRVAEACAAGDRDPLIGPAMVHSEMELSYDKIDGKVTFYPDVKHQFVLSRKGENLDFIATTAEHSGFSAGTVASEIELFRKLKVDDPTRFEINPAGKEIAEKWQKLIKGAKDEVPILLEKRNIEASSQGGVAFLQARIRTTQKIIDWFKKCPPAMTYDLNIDQRAVQGMKDEIIEMRKQIKEIQTAAQAGN